MAKQELLKLSFIENSANSDTWGDNSEITNFQTENDLKIDKVLFLLFSKLIIKIQKYKEIVILLKRMSLIPKAQSIKLKELGTTFSVNQNNSNASSFLMSQSNQSFVNSISDYISVWSQTFKSIDSQNDIENFNFTVLQSCSKASNINSVKDHIVQVGALKLIHIDPILTGEIKNFNSIDQLLEGFSDQSISLLEKLKVANPHHQDFCEVCGKDFEARFFNLIVHITN